MVQRLEYYTGVVFRGFARGAAAQVLSGGRYDALVGRYGAELPATGFAVDVESLADCLPQPELPQPGTLVWYEDGCLGAALALVEQGCAVLSAARTEEEARAEARQKGMTLQCVRPERSES
jgi:ATP phosphoribosyltransferase regulatory subunit